MKEPQLAFSLLRGKNIHLAACGSVAVYKTLDLMRSWQDLGAEVSVTLSQAAREFITPLSFTALGAAKVYTGLFPDAPDSPGFPGSSLGGSSGFPGEVMGHLEPGQSADAFIVMPASANTMAKIAHGIADDMLSTQALAFPKPLIIVPAMNPRMWSNQATRANVALLRERGHIIVDPDAGCMACREEGEGRLADPREVHCALLKSLTVPYIEGMEGITGMNCAKGVRDMRGRRVLVTAGPTQEPWDGVRYWTNPSSGLMGACLAIAAYLRGAEVHMAAGPMIPWLPKGIFVHHTRTAAEMFQASMELWPDMDYGIFSAAVADFSPEPFGAEKFKKERIGTGKESELVIRFRPNRDILATAGQQKKPGQKLVGFAAETERLEEAVRAKLKRKNCDLLAGNFINRPGAGFKSANNTMFVADSSGREESWPELPKSEVAWRILNWLADL